MFQS
jgi:hypothetical protein